MSTREIEIVGDWILRCKNHPTERIHDMMYDMLHADSRCLTLLAKAIVKVQGSKSSVSKEVQSEADALEAYEVLDDEDLPISLVVRPPKDKHLQVKQLLTFLGPTAATAKTDVKPRSYDRLSVDGLSDYVIDCVKKIEFNHFKSLSMYMNLADALQALMHNLQHYEGKRACTKEECYPVIHERTGIAKNDGIKHKVTKDTDFDRMKQKKKRERDLKDELKRKRIEAVRVINYIVRKGCSDDFSLKHTFVKRQELLECLGIPDGVVPRGYEITPSNQEANIPQMMTS
ncbi:UNVERIFIED_CONTAM: hypothetical protein HDU68_000169 [Siphonaria sp. JEL0065]|nr:hypothetical protein HDU68_000169 [Siphonaria sp. JEL0065]